MERLRETSSILIDGKRTFDIEELIHATLKQWHTENPSDGDLQPLLDGASWVIMWRFDGGIILS